MATTTQQGSPQFPATSSAIAASSQETMNAAIHTLQEQKDAWLKVSVRERIQLIDTLIKDFAAISGRWVDACCQAKGIGGIEAFAGEEWSIGLWPTLKTMRQLRQALIDIEANGRPHIPGPIRTLPNGQVSAQVFPYDRYDGILFTGVTAEIWMEPGVTAETLPQTQAVAYHDKNHPGKVTLVLGAGNASSIGPLDILYKLFVEDQVVVLKTNPVNAYLGPLIEEGFRSLIERGFLRVVSGGAAEGAYLCNHPGVEEIHITGSDKTFEAIVFGPGPEGAKRKAENKPLLHKRITGELGNVSPVIIVPGPWSAADLAYQADHLVAMLTTNAGFNCNATRVIIQHEGWDQREALLQAMRHVLTRVPTRDAYYPGAHDRQQAFVAAHPEAEQIGPATNQQMPWTLITGVDPTLEDDICFTTEAFCGLFAESPLPAERIPAYIDRAVEFCNETLWGTLNATILVHPTSLKDPQIAAALERATANLRYGTIGINYWAGAGYTLGTSTWGAYPGHTIQDIQSGTGVVHNSLMFSQPQKTVLRAPFRSVPTPPWFATRGRTAAKVFPKLVALEAEPSPLKLPGILWSAIMG